MRPTDPLLRLCAVIALVLPLAAQHVRLELRPCTDRGSKTSMHCGVLEVWENRDRESGRKIPLHIAVLQANGPAEQRRPDPVFWLAGGPGQAATRLVRQVAGSWLRRQRDIVLVDQRGTGRSNGLYVRVPGGPSDIQGNLEPLFDVDSFRRALPELQARADLTQYTTERAADDLDDVRRALGYDKINLVGGSYGTRMAMIYMRRYPQHTRTAILNGVAPVAFKNPLYHARAAQDALDLLFDEVEASDKYRAEFPDLRRRFAALLEQLAERPAEVELRRGNDTISVKLTRDGFAEALRILMYYSPRNRRVPYLLHRACDGDLRTFAAAGIQANLGLRGSLAFGMLMSVVGSEDIPRIREDEIGPATAGTFLGDGRVRRQMAVAEIWPRGEVDPAYGEPLTVDVPILMLSGTHDPVSAPNFAVAAAKHLPQCLHICVPGAHGVGGTCLTRIQRQFLASASVEGLDTDCVRALRHAPLATR